MKYLDELKKEDIAGKKVLLRADFDIPRDGGKIQDTFRINAQKETVDYLVKNEALILMVAHLTKSDETFEPFIKEISEILGYPIRLISLVDFNNGNYVLSAGEILLLDNIRRDHREENNDDELARNLSKGFDLYVNNDFAVSHRNHASVCAITKHLPFYGGLLIKKETLNLSRAINEPAEGKILILGGAKISTKLPVINNFFNKAEKIIVGGALANNFFLQIFGINVGSSIVDENVSVSIKSEKIILPEDILIAEDKSGEGPIRAYPVADVKGGRFIADVGPRSVEKFADIIKVAKMVIWNGPMGYFEIEKFSHGTNVIARAMADSPAETIIGGGDTISAVNGLGLLEKFSYVSTGGGAMLQFLAGNRLPGLEALGYYE